MEEIYEEAPQGFEVTEAMADRIRGLIRDARGLEIHISGPGIFVEALPQPPYGVRQTLGRFDTMLEAQNFARAWLTGPYGVARDYGRSTKIGHNLCGIDFEALIQDIQEYLKGGKIHVKELIRLLSELGQQSWAEGEWSTVHGPIGAESVNINMSIILEVCDEY